MTDQEDKLVKREIISFQQCVGSRWMQLVEAGVPDRRAVTPVEMFVHLRETWYDVELDETRMIEHIVPIPTHFISSLTTNVGNVSERHDADEWLVLTESYSLLTATNARDAYDEIMRQYSLPTPCGHSFWEVFAQSQRVASWYVMHKTCTKCETKS